MQATVMTPELEAAPALEAPPTPPAPTPRGQWRSLGFSLATGLLLFLCHFPVAWGWLAWVALVPYLTLTRTQARGRWLFVCAWASGLAYYWPAISWMSVADSAMVACWALLATYCALYFPLTIYLVRRLQFRLGLPLVLTLPVVWTALEYFRSWFGTGFSWYLLGHTQHEFLAIIQIADLGGAPLVGFLILVVNAVIFDGLCRLPAVRGCFGVLGLTTDCCKYIFAAEAGCAVLLFSAALGYGVWRLSEDDFETGPRVALLQADVDQRLRIDAERKNARAQQRIRAVYGELCLQAGTLQPRPDLIIWPETSSPDPWIAVTGTVPANRKRLAAAQESVRSWGARTKTHVLMGVNTESYDLGKDKMYRHNSALLLDAEGNDLKRYDKIHRVPFGEYVPFRDWLPFMNVFSPYDHDYSITPGDGLTRFQLGKYTFGVLVCYEDTDMYMGRDYGVDTADGPAVDFLVNISNDGWFDGSAEHEEHLAISRFRAIETRRALVRSVNMGISAVIDGNGRVLAPTKMAGDKYAVWAVPEGSHPAALPTSEWHEYKKVDGILVADVPLDRRTSLFARWGDWLPNGCWLLIGGTLVWSRLRGRKEKA